ncbi:MAG: NAD(P)H-dependent oxidoreductase [Solirubrobacteraceae bacterium]|nr:NAD(P)H-dependent oxidoreductase [Solirubrobacteraceae bacterium]
MTTPILLRVDSSLASTEQASVTRALADRAVEAYLAAHPDGEVRTRDLVASPPPHFDPVAQAARRRGDTLTPAESKAAALADEYAAELRDATDLVIGMPLYNWGPPSTLKAWFDHVIASPIARHAQTMEPMIKLRSARVIVARGGAYGPETLRAGWDHATDWAEKSFTAIGVDLEVVAVEMTLAPGRAYLAEFEHVYHRDRAVAEERLAGAFAVGAA